MVGHTPARRNGVASAVQVFLHTFYGCQGYLVTDAKNRVNDLDAVSWEGDRRHSGQADLVGKALRDKRRFTYLLAVADWILKMVTPADHLLNV